LVLLAFVCSASEAATRPNRNRAAELAQAGARAYSVGNYGFAIQAFKQAHALSLRDGLLFSTAQAYRQRHALEAKPNDLAQAVAHYRRYLVAAPRGEHAAEAERALAELEPRLSPDTRLRPETFKTRLAVTSDILGASLRIDGKRPRRLPLFTEVAPGRHTLVVVAPGYQPMRRVVRLGERALLPMHFSLRPKPAELSIEAPSDAEVRIDGKLIGSAPLEDPIRLSAGKHSLRVTKTGHHSYARDVHLERGKAETVYVSLERTDQRKAAIALIATGTAAVAAGIVFGVLSVVEHRRAIDIQDQFGGELDNEAQAEYDAAIAARDNYRIVSGVTAGTGFGLFLVGGALFVLDDPPGASVGATWTHRF
jgi:hypothetical protein